MGCTSTKVEYQIIEIAVKIENLTDRESAALSCSVKEDLIVKLLEEIYIKIKECKPNSLESYALREVRHAVEKTRHYDNQLGENIAELADRVLHILRTKTKGMKQISPAEFFSKKNYINFSNVQRDERVKTTRQDQKNTIDTTDECSTYDSSFICLDGKFETRQDYGFYDFESS